MATSSHSSVAGKGIPILFYAGESLGKKDKGAAAAILLLPTGQRASIKQLLSSVSATEAAYRALLIGLHKAWQLGIHQIEVKGHDETVFNQVNGLAEIEEPILRHLHREVMMVMKQFDRVMVEWIPLDQNRSACQTAQKCLAEVTRPGGISDSAPMAIAPEIGRLIKLGNRATAKDFRALKQETDEFSFKSLDELRHHIPVRVQDMLALQWNGDEQELAEMYRWYLRGLPPRLIARKFQLEGAISTQGENYKLPWEDQLRSHSATNNAFDTLTNEPFLDEVFTDSRDDFREIQFLPPTPPPLFAPLEEIDLPLEEVFSLTEPGFTPSVETLAAGPLPLAEGQEDPFSTANDEQYQERLSHIKDTLPSVDRVQQIVSMTMHLSPADKTRLVKELAQFPELSNQFLRAIAERLKPS